MSNQRIFRKLLREEDIPWAVHDCCAVAEDVFSLRVNSDAIKSQQFRQDLRVSWIARNSDLFGSICDVERKEVKGYFIISSIL